MLQHLSVRCTLNNYSISMSQSHRHVPYFWYNDSSLFVFSSRRLAGTTVTLQGNIDPVMLFANEVSNSPSSNFKMQIIVEFEY